MTNQRDQLLQLLQKGEYFLERPEDEERWHAFQTALEIAESAEKTAVSSSRENLIKLSEPRQLQRGHHNAEHRLPYRPIIWATLLISIIFMIIVFGIAQRFPDEVSNIINFPVIGFKP